MIRNEITAIKFKLDDKTKKYAKQKLARLERYINRSDRQASYLKVVLTEKDSEPDGRFICEAMLSVPKEKFLAKEATTNMFGSIDMVEEKLTSQILKRKGKLLRSRAKAQQQLRRFRRRLPFGRAR